MNKSKLLITTCLLGLCLTGCSQKEKSEEPIKLEKDSVVFKENVKKEMKSEEEVSKDKPIKKELSEAELKRDEIKNTIVQDKKDVKSGTLKKDVASDGDKDVVVKYVDVVNKAISNNEFPDLQTLGNKYFFSEASLELQKYVRYVKAGFIVKDIDVTNYDKDTNQLIITWSNAKGEVLGYTSANYFKVYKQLQLVNSNLTKQGNELFSQLR